MQMKVYELRPLPKRLDDRNWSASIIAKRCITFAKNERQARQNAAITFSISTRKDCAGVRTPPWTDAALVSCREVLDYKGNVGVEGQVIVGDCVFEDAVA